MSMDAHPLREFRDREKLSQGQLAELLGVSRVSVTRWENRTRLPDEKHLPLIQQKTGIQPSALRPDTAAIFKEAAE